MNKTNSRLKLFRECFKNQIDNIETLNITRKYEHAVLIIDNVLNDIYHETYNNDTSKEDNIFYEVNDIDADISAYYNLNLMYFIIQVDNIDYDNKTVMFKQLQQKYKMVANKMMELYYKSCRS